MKKQLLLFLITILTVNSYSQITYEKGYYITNSGQKIDCLIKNIDWRKNPTEFKYKATEKAENKTATIKSVKEFRIYNSSKYLRSKVKIDRTTENTDDLNHEKNPIFKEEELFLKVLIEGGANLYEYIDDNLTRYFFSKENVAIEQLVFKKYLKNENQVGINSKYRQQLWDNLKCSNFTIDKLQNIDYEKKDLNLFFIEYNQCNNQKFINFNKKKQRKKDVINFNIRVGLNNSSLTIQNDISNSRDTDFGNEIGFRLGIETEFIMPFNKNKWAVLIEPTYQSFKSQQELTRRNVEVDYKSIEIPIGIRHYFFLNENAKIFINGSYIFDFSLDSAINFDPGTDLEIETGENLALGLGYKHNNKYSLELRYHTSRNVLRNFTDWRSDFNTISLIFGYTIF